MRTISIAELKAHLSAELKKVQAGDPVTVLDHKKPVAVLGPVKQPGYTLTITKPRTNFSREPLGWEALTDHDPLPGLLEDREDRW